MYHRVHSSKFLLTSFGRSLMQNWVKTSFEYPKYCRMQNSSEKIWMLNLKHRAKQQKGHIGFMAYP